jgi:predicted transcriptional regulator
MKFNPSDIGTLEREVMQLLWADSPLTAVTVRERLARQLKESTVRTVLGRLEDKGYIYHTVSGRTFVYWATEPRAVVAARAVQRVVDQLCNGSIEELLIGMLELSMLDRRRLRMVTNRIKRKRAKQ